MYRTFLLRLFKYELSIIILGGMKVPEVQRNDIPIPLVNYVHLITNRKSPYYDVVSFLLKDMEMHYKKTEEESEILYTINPRILQEEIEKKVENEKLTTLNICRTIIALFYGSALRNGDDFYISTTSGGRRNYHVKVNARTLGLMNRFI